MSDEAAIIQRDKSELVELSNLLLQKLNEVAPDWTRECWKSRPSNARGIIQAMFPNYAIQTPAFQVLKGGK